MSLVAPILVFDRKKGNLPQNLAFAQEVFLAIVREDLQCGYVTAVKQILDTIRDMDARTDRRRGQLLEPFFTIYSALIDTGQSESFVRARAPRVLLF